jgi:predicted GIY-YIG superfamily endonuclease
MADAHQQLIYLTDLPALSFHERHALPQCQAVYVVMTGKAVLYVGQTRQLRTRWRNHHLCHQLAQLEEVRILWHEENQKFARDRMEDQAIKLFHPRFNKALVRRPPTYKTVTTTLSNHLYHVLQDLASKSDLCVSQQIRILLREALEKRDILILEP